MMVTQAKLRFLYFPHNEVKGTLLTPRENCQEYDVMHVHY